MVNRAGKIYRYANSSWTQVSGGSGKDITVSGERDVFLTNHDGKIYSRRSNSWKQLDGSDGVAVSANAGRLVMVNTKGRLFYRTY